MCRWIPVLGIIALSVIGCGRPAANSPDLAPARVTRAEADRPNRRPANHVPYETAGGRDDSRSRPTQPSEGNRATNSNSSLIYVWFSEVWQSPAQNKANPNNIADACARVIDSARTTLDVCVFEINNDRIVGAILNANRRGVKVRVVTEKDYIEDSGPQEFKRAGIPVIPDNRSDLMHDKFMIVDDRMVWTGSFNFTENCAYKNNNNGILLIDDKLAANYEEKFRWFWQYQKFGGRPARDAEIPYPVVRLGDGTTVENYFSTHDKVDTHVMELIGKARKSIVFMAFSYTHDGIAQAMIRAANNGVRVVGVVETRQSPEKGAYAKLRGIPGIEVLLDGNPYNMHHKVIVLDDQVVIAGSYNFTASATTGNDENVVIVYNADVAAKYTDEFRRVYQAAANHLSDRDTSQPR